jgi:O-antigen/teichoic acid export membrane protein
MKKELKQEGENLKQIFKKIKKKDFSGNSGIAIKNSIYDFATTFIEKIGALIFVIILARILMPELFGLYSLALSTVLLFVTFSDLGISQTLVKFISQALGKNKPEKAKAYVLYLAKIKIISFLIIIIFFAISSKFISQNYYNKPIFLALLAGVFYILFVGIIRFIQLLFQSTNNFKILFFKQIFFQVLRIIIVPILVLYSLQHFVSKEINILIPIASLSLVWFLTLLFLLLFRKKIYFLYLKAEKLPQDEKKKINKFILGLILFSLSGLFFGYIDIIFLGRFVLSNFIGYYQVAFSIISSFAPLIFFSSALLPIFSKINGERLEKGFQKSLKIIFILSLLFFLFTFIFAPLLIKIIYGQSYSDSTILLRFLSFLLISLPLISIYTSYFISKAEIKVITRLIIISTIINILLNYILIRWLINYSQLLAVIGVCIATLVSKYFYLFGLIFFRKKQRKLLDITSNRKKN